MALIGVIAIPWTTISRSIGLLREQVFMNYVLRYIVKIGFISLLLVLPVSMASTQDMAFLQSAFESAGSEFGVPPDVLRGIAFAETRWEHLQWADGDSASCAGLPRSYGLMALRSDNWFGHSLEKAAGLIGMEPEVLKKDVVHNIRGAASYLRSLYELLPVTEGTARGDLESWQSAVAAYCGIPQRELAQQHALQIYERLAKGYDDFGIRIQARSVNLEPLRRSAVQTWSDVHRTNTARLNKKADQPDYPEADWIPAYTGHWYTSGITRDFIVIHDMEGYYLSVLSYFQQSTTQASAHYCINGLQDNPGDSLAGDIAQMVEEQYWAWHARCWNRYSLGIEHEGFANNPAWFSPEMYVASARLTKYMCDKYGIPKDRNHIIAHGEKANGAWVNWVNTVYKTSYPDFDPNCNDHTDPGPYWDWDFYMQIIKEDSAAPQVVSIPPAQPIQVYESVSVTFDQRMHRELTESAFSISPAIAGTLAWSVDFRTLSFSPNTQFQFDTTYTLTIDSTAKNYLDRGLDVDHDSVGGGEIFSFTFQTAEVDSIPPSLMSSYPANNQTGVSTSLECILRYSEPLQEATLSGAFSFRDADSVLVDANPLITADIQASGTVIRVKPQASLDHEQTYTLIVSDQIKDYGNNSVTPFSVSFTTGNAVSFPGTSINEVENTGDWWQPSVSGSTTGVIATWGIVTNVKKSGNGAGKLSYEFQQTSGGIIREHTPTTPGIETGGSLIGVWVYGDNSGHSLRFLFYHTTTPGYSIIHWGPINWTGWNLVTLPISSIPTGTRRFSSFMVYQVSGGPLSGTIYFDDLRTGNTVTDVAGDGSPSLPAEFNLAQNFPNPFNPATIIEFSIPRQVSVNVSVYNVLGQRVTVLLDEEQPAGVHRLAFDASGFASGLYFYRIVAGEFVAVKKMTILK